MFEVRILSDRKELEAAYRLNYQVFCEEQRWSWKADGNKSALRVVESPEGPMMVDDFNELATWYGCFHEGALVGAFRTCPARNGKFEVEHYTQISALYHQYPTVELTRLCVDKNFRSTPVRLLLLATGGQIMFASGIHFIICTAIFPRPGELYLSMGLEVDTDCRPFRYNSDDPFEVMLLRYPLIQFLERAKTFNQLVDQMTKSPEKLAKFEAESVQFSKPKLA